MKERKDYPSLEPLVRLRNEKTESLKTDPHNPLLYLQRAKAHSRLGFLDLAAADAYRALTLFDSVVDPDFSEYPARRRVGIRDDRAEACLQDSAEGKDYVNEDGDFEPISHKEYSECIRDVYLLLCQGLLQCGCMRDAYEFCVQAVHLADCAGNDSHAAFRRLLETIKQSSAQCKHGASGVENGEFDPARLQAQGVARRVQYPWNQHESDRGDPDTLTLLNKRLKTVAPKCEVRTVSLPVLHERSNSGGSDASNGQESEAKAVPDQEVSVQLGLVATQDIAPGEVLLQESSLLTATNRLHDSICDACNERLPGLSASHEQHLVSCGDCTDTIFCSQRCHDQAQEVYHAAVCGREGLDSIGKDVPDPRDKADYLYLLLLARAIAMAATQEVHPLDLPETKYIWGDFHELEQTIPDPSSSSRPPSATLPFSFQLNILQPMRILEALELDPFVTLPFYDTWVINTLYAKFRGTASGRLSNWDGGPEVCAVHPLWCLANHSCDPNVRWEWGGEITFTARNANEKARWGNESMKQREQQGGIKKGEEILNHYCDIGLTVKDRREWAMGALGGPCRCERCVWEVEHAPA